MSESERHEITVGSDLSAEQQLAMINQLSEGNYVPRIELVGSNSQLRKQGLANDGEFWHNGNTNFGTQFVAVIFDWRSHAIMFDDNGQVIAESFDPASEVFKIIKGKEGGGKIKNERPGTGADFLVWIPKFQVMGILPLMKTARRAIKPAYTALMQKAPILVRSYMAKSGGNEWPSPAIGNFEGTLGENDAPSHELLEKSLGLFKQQQVMQVAEQDSRPR